MAAAKRTTWAEEWRQTLPERDECEHSQNAAYRSIRPVCQNRGPAKGERKAVRIGPRVGSQRRRCCQWRRHYGPLLRRNRSGESGVPVWLRRRLHQVLHADTLGVNEPPTVFSRLASGTCSERSPVAPPELRTRRRSVKYASTAWISLRSAITP